MTISFLIEVEFPASKNKLEIIDFRITAALSRLFPVNMNSVNASK